ncbi:ABC transporter ATP-binding protein [Leisingera sp. JC1]|uniref:ABC transporter ATP-binding protein n=1 Tax=Leisingera sp. JC1 TaxID=1855282 RepID=UPI0008036C2D|nr:ABC transporter ATP-binding protein [Leisingera sp. JC1]OBY26574.1 ABC transporter ATP-binding protein [Leisingera sp. JC1]
MLEIQNVSVRYGRHQALFDIAAQVERGKITVLLGTNGAGKSTFLKALGGLVPTGPGASIKLGGVEIAAIPAHRRVEAGLALVPEGRGIFGKLSVAENLHLGGFAHRARTDEKERLERVLDLFPRLRERMPQIARTMSGGEQQMVAMGRAMMSHPDFLLLDEPSLGLSPLLSKDMFKSLRRIASEADVGILLVEQNAKLSLEIADYGYLLENGHIVGQGPAEELRSSPAVLRAYLGEEVVPA